jgi:hypothetical protein
MSYDDYDVIVYKVLKYIYQCLKAGVYPSLDKAQELTRCNDVYWLHVIQSMLNDGYIQGVKIPEYLGNDAKPIAEPKALGLSQKGAQYLTNNSKMAEVKSFLGKAFEGVIEVAIKATDAAM